MTGEEWNTAYVSHIREVVALIESMEDKSPENIINRLNGLAELLEGMTEDSNV